MSQKDKVPSYQVPERVLQMANGERWTFRFDNRALHHMDKNYGGAPGSLEMFHSLTATQQVRDGQEVSLDRFIDEIMPPLIDPDVKIPLDELLAEVNAKQVAARVVKLGNEPAPIQSATPSEIAGSGETITAE